MQANKGIAAIASPVLQRSFTSSGALLPLDGISSLEEGRSKEGTCAIEEGSQILLPILEGYSSREATYS